MIEEKYEPWWPIEELPNNPFIYTFCKTKTSNFLEWFKQESYGMFSELDENHYLICNSDNIIDVITNQIPELMWID